MALPFSGPLSFSAIHTEFTNGGCLEAASEYSLSAFAAAIGGVAGSSIATSAFYGGECPPIVLNCYCYSLELEALITYYEFTDCCGERAEGTTSQGIIRCCDANNPPFASSGTWYQLGPCECGGECGKGG